MADPGFAVATVCVVAVLGVTIGEAIILLGVFALLIDRVLEVMGKSRSSRVLRAENQDLIRRLSQVEAAEIRCQAQVQALERRVVDLETSLETLDTLRRRQT